MKMSKKVSQEMRKFKMRVGLEAYNALQLQANFNYTRHRVKIGNADFVFYPTDRKEVDKILRGFKTTVW